MIAASTPARASARVLIVATLDTKGAEVAFAYGVLRDLGRSVLVLDVGSAAASPDAQSIRASDILRVESATTAMGEGPAAALDVKARKAKAAVARLYGKGRIGAVLGVAGGKGSALFKTAVEELPYGFPKALVSSARPQLLASFAQTTDVVLFPTLVDLFGVNSFTERVLRNATHAIAAMVWHPPTARTKQVVGITAFGVTTPAVSRCVALLQQAGMEPLAFPANGAGGQLMEKLVRAGEIDAVLDITTTELADELVGGTASAGPHRLTAAGSRGLPHLVAPGAVDMVNFGPRAQVPEAFQGRRFYQHTPQTTLMRTTADENRRIGALAGNQLSKGIGPLLVLVPARGVSDYDRPGQPFFDLEADRAWLDGLRATLPDRARLEVLDLHINDPAFAKAAVDWILDALAPSKADTDAQDPV